MLISDHFTGSIAAFFARNFIKRPRTHEILTRSRLHNSFFNAQLIEEHQNFKQTLCIFIFQIGHTSARWYNKAQKGVKLHLPFNRKPPLKYRDDFGRADRFER